MKRKNFFYGKTIQIKLPKKLRVRKGRKNVLNANKFVERNRTEPERGRGWKFRCRLWGMTEAWASVSHKSTISLGSEEEGGKLPTAPCVAFWCGLLYTLPRYAMCGGMKAEKGSMKRHPSSFRSIPVPVDEPSSRCSFCLPSGKMGFSCCLQLRGWRSLHTALSGSCLALALVRDPLLGAWTREIALIGKWIIK